jgi:predicted DNA-binding protein YlxM (UPF0122 family)
MQTEKYFALSLLLDIYGTLLTQKQREALEMYLNEDLSLSEIAENTGISRQAAQDSIKKAEQRLQEWEMALGICRKRQQIEAVLQQMQTKEDSAEAGIEQIRKILWEE